MKPGSSYGIQMGLVTVKQCLRKATSAACKGPLDLRSLRPVNLSNSEKDSLKHHAIYLGISWEHCSADHACHGNCGIQRGRGKKEIFKDKMRIAYITSKH